MKTTVWCWLFAILAGLGARANAQGLDDTCVIFGPFARQVRANRDGSFVLFMPIVNPTRLTVLCERDGLRLYGQSEFFDLIDQGTVPAGAIRLSPTPFSTIERIVATPGTLTLTAVGQTTPMSVTGFFSDGSIDLDTAPRSKGSQYATSNALVAAVDQNGLVTAVAEGSVLITVSNQGNVTTAPIAVVIGGTVSTLEGFLQYASGAPVPGATVTLPDLSASDVTDTGGRFEFGGVSVEPPQQRLMAGIVSGLDAFFYYDPELELFTDRKTDAGILTVNENTFWTATTGGNWNDTSKWLAAIEPRRNNFVTVDVPGGDFQIVKKTAAESTMRTLLMKEKLRIEDGNFSVAQTLTYEKEFEMQLAGKLQNATVVRGGGAPDMKMTNSLGPFLPTLEGVTLDTNLVINPDIDGTVRNGLTLNGNVSLTASTSPDPGNGTDLFFDGGTQSLLGTGQIVFPTFGQFHRLRLRNGVQLTIGPNITVVGGVGRIENESGASSLVNQGTIRSNQSGNQISIGGDVPSSGGLPSWRNEGLIEVTNSAKLALGGTSWVNQGTITAGSGTELDIQATGLSNTGTLQATNPTRVYLHGSFAFSQLGTYTVSGGEIQIGRTDRTATVTGGFDLASQNTSWAAYRTTFTGGTIDGTGKTLTIRPGASVTGMNGITLNANVACQNEFSDIDVRDGLTLNGTLSMARGDIGSSNPAVLAFIGNQTLSGSGQVVLPSNGFDRHQLIISANTGETLTIGSSITISGGFCDFDGGGAFLNQGTIRADVNGHTMRLRTFTNAGTMLATNAGRMQPFGNYEQTAGTTQVDASSTFTVPSGSTMQINGGTLKGVGTVVAAVSVGGTCAPGASAGRLTITGTYTQTSTGTLAIEIGGTTQGSQYDHLQVSGAVALDGPLTVTLINGFTPTTGQTFTIVTGSPVTGTFSSTPPGFTVQYNATSVVLVAQ